MDKTLKDPTFLAARKAMVPLQREILQSIDKADGETKDAISKLFVAINKNEINTEDLAKGIGELIAGKILVKTEQLEDRIIAKVEVPQQIGELVAAITSLIVALKSAPAMSDYKPSDQDIPNENIGFYGFVSTSGAWYIMQNNTQSGTQRYAAGADNYQEAWNNRTKLKYVILSEAFNG